MLNETVTSAEEFKTLDDDIETAGVTTAAEVVTSMIEDDKEEEHEGDETEEEPAKPPSTSEVASALNTLTHFAMS